ncbi:two-component response regulator, partial [Candidatus Gastranaerophilus sp. (ex Termes propinquus)]
MLSFLSTKYSFFSQIQKSEPELIIISDTIDEKLSDFCKQIRVLTFNSRPIILAVSKSSELEDRLETLDSGADDFLSESMSSKEFQARTKAHLRRYVEGSLHPVTLFVKDNLAEKTLKKLTGAQNDAAVILADVSSLGFYREIYGEIAYEKVLQTLGAIINSTLSKGDFIGHWRETGFLAVTSFEKAERVASFLTFAFDNVKERFYSEFDYKNGFIVLSSDNMPESKMPLMKLSIGIVALDKNFQNYKQVLNSLLALVKLCGSSEKSCYVMDRPKLYGKTEAVAPKNKVLILERDEALLCLLRATCEMRGLCVKDTLESTAENIADVIIIDYGKGEGVDICKEIRKNFKGKIIFTSSVHKKK